MSIALTSQDLWSQQQQLYRKLRFAEREVISLDMKVNDLQIRYDRASRDHNKAFMYTIRGQLATTRNVLGMYQQYVGKVWMELQKVQDQLVLHGEMSDSFQTDSD